MNSVRGGVALGTILRNSEWENKKTVQKGNLGERIVQKFIESKGFIVYSAITEGAHAFDFLAIKDKKLAIAAEVKTKSLMNKYKATGFNKSQWQYYMNFSKKHNIQIFVFFVDEHLKKIYGNWLSVLEEQREQDGRIYPFDLTTMYGATIRLYPFSAMKEIADIDDNTAQTLKDLSQRNYEYRQE